MFHWKTTQSDVDVGHFLNLTPFGRRNDVNLTTRIRDVLYNQSKPNPHEKFLFLSYNMGEILFSIPSEKLGFPYLVCKKITSHAQSKK